MVPTAFTIPGNRYGAPLAWQHRLFWRIVRAIGRLYPLRVEGAERLPRAGPAVVIAPHMSYSDSFLFLYPALPRPVRFLSSDFFVHASALSSWLMFLGGVLPLSKRAPDAQAARRALRVLARGDVVALFPEGERCWTGASMEPIAPSAKFLARLKVPVFVAEIEGSYDHWPRWARAPRWRPVTMRLRGPVALPAPVEVRPRPARRRWWDAVYQSGGSLDAAAAMAVLAGALHEASRSESTRLDLTRAGRFRCLPRLICYCPECARPEPVADGGRLACRSCGAAWVPAGGGMLRRHGATNAGAPQLLGDVFLAMRERLRDRAVALLPLEEPVAVAVMDRPGPAARGRARLDRNGMVVTAGTARWEIDLAAVAGGEIEGATVLEVKARCGAALSLKSGGGVLRLVLAAGALLDHPPDRFVPAVARAAGAGESHA